MDNGVSVKHVELTFMAIGRVNWDRKLIRGLVLKMNDNDENYTRVGLFQSPDEAESAIQIWDIKAVVVV